MSTLEKHRIALVFYSALDGAGNSATYRNLMFAQELQRHDDDVVLVFDGAGTRSLAEMAKPEHRFHGLLLSLRDRVRGGCHFCAKNYGVLRQLEDAGLPLLGDDRGHASLRELLNEGRQILNV